MDERHLSSLPFELAYLAMLTRRGVKRLSRWERSLSPEHTDLIRSMGLHVRPVTRRTLFGRKVSETVFAAREAAADFYVSRFDGKRLSSSPGETRLKGFIFGYPSCCVEEFIRHPYSKNGLSRRDQRILFHWACPGCKVTPGLIKEYGDIYRECAKVLRPAPAHHATSAASRKRDAFPVLRLLRQASVPAAAGLAAMLLLPAAARGDDPHWLAVPDDLDSDYAIFAEEVLAGYSWRGAYSVSDSLLDGVYLAHFLHAMIESLPDTPQTDQPYKEYEFVYGIETCDVCGADFNMGSIRIVNPQRGLEMEFPIIGLHYLEHGSLSYMGTVHDGRVDLYALKRVLLAGDESHHLTYEGDTDADGLFPEEEAYLGTNPTDPDSDDDSVKDGPQYFEGLVEALSQVSRTPSDTEPYIEEWFARGKEQCEICGQWFNMGYVVVNNTSEGLSLMLPYVSVHCLTHGSAVFNGTTNDGRILPVLLNTALRGDGQMHWLEVEDDGDGDGLKDVEESHFGLDSGLYDSDGNGVPDGPQLAGIMHDIIAGLPEGETPDTTYVVHNYTVGSYPCLICGEDINMGFMDIVNPQNGTSISLPYYNLHFMEHGSFETDRSDIYARIDPRDIDAVIDASAHVPQGPAQASPVQVFPNPFTEKTRVVLNLPVAAAVDVSVFDVNGRSVLSKRTEAEKRTEFFWYGRDGEGKALPPGVYFFRFDFDGTTLTRKVMLLR